eukprot:Gb_12406 [translate_table: standard]
MQLCPTPAIALLKHKRPLEVIVSMIISVCYNVYPFCEYTLSYSSAPAPKCCSSTPPLGNSNFFIDIKPDEKRIFSSWCSTLVLLFSQTNFERTNRTDFYI